MCHRTRQESTTPRLRFSYDLTVARSQVKVTFANTRLPRTVLFAHLEHTITHPEPSSRTIRTWFRSAFDLLEHREHEYSCFIVLLELEVIYSNMTNMTMCTSSGRDFNDVPYFTVGLARTLPVVVRFEKVNYQGSAPPTSRSTSWWRSKS
jgi:hypothetical protein